MPEDTLLVPVSVDESSTLEDIKSPIHSLLYENYGGLENILKAWDVPAEFHEPISAVLALRADQDFVMSVYEERQYKIKEMQIYSRHKIPEDKIPEVQKIVTAIVDLWQKIVIAPQSPELTANFR